jgi:RHS repeat-associated protein
VAVNPDTQAATVRRQTPFGAPRGTTVTWPDDKGFVGGVKDGTGTTHLGVREYDPATGQFLSVDPQIDPTEPQQLNPYSYAGGSPVSFSDPDGRVQCGDDACNVRAVEQPDGSEKIVGHYTQSEKEDTYYMNHGWTRLGNGRVCGLGCDGANHPPKPPAPPKPKPTVANVYVPPAALFAPRPITPPQVCVVSGPVGVQSCRSVNKPAWNPSDGGSPASWDDSWNGYTSAWDKWAQSYVTAKNPAGMPEAPVFTGNGTARDHKPDSNTETSGRDEGYGGDATNITVSVSACLWICVGIAFDDNGMYLQASGPGSARVGAAVSVEVGSTQGPANEWGAQACAQVVVGACLDSTGNTFIFGPGVGAGAGVTYSHRVAGW